jgi:hypothetical protein
VFGNDANRLAASELRRLALVVIATLVLVPIMPAITNVGEVIQPSIVVAVLPVKSSLRGQTCWFAVTQVPLADDGRVIPYLLERCWHRGPLLTRPGDSVCLVRMARLATAS